MNSRAFTWLLLALVMAVALGLRFLGLTGIGVGGSDTILYYTLAEYWIRGDLTFAVGDSIEVFRPVLLGFNALALLLFGHTDVAIKLANVLLDGANMALVALLAWQLSRSRWVAVASAASYGLLPIAIWASRQELPHTPSTFFVLLSFLAAFRGAWVRGQRQTIIWMACSGLALLAAVMTHEELVFLALPLMLAFVLGRRAVASTDPVSPWPALGAFCLFPLLAALLVLGHGGERVVSTLRPGVGDSWTMVVQYPERAARFAWNGVVGASSAVFALGIAFSALHWLLSLRGERRGEDRYAIGYGMCLLTPLLFIATYAVFFGTVFPRAILPLMPLLVVAVFMSVDRALAGKPVILRNVAATALVAVFAISNLASFTAFKVGNRRFGLEWAAPDWPTPALLQRGYGEFLLDARYIPSYATHWRRIHDVLVDRVDGDNRLLVAPSVSLYAAGRRPLQTEVYLGDNAVYRLDHFDQPLAAVLLHKKIRFVVYTIAQVRSAPSIYRPYTYGGTWGKAREVDLAKAYGLPEYSARAEFYQLTALLRELGARPLTLFPPDSFEARYARVWQLP
jgi:4-amino-4-deoxy-L-arabinose transferase-like glycosyltransferase